MRYSKHLKKAIMLAIFASVTAFAIFGLSSGLISKKTMAFGFVYDCDWCAASTGDVYCNSCENEIYRGMEKLWNYFKWFFYIDEGGQPAGLYQLWWLDIWDIIEAELPVMTQQLTAASFLPTTFVGHFFDARHQLETQAVIDQYHVTAIRDYQPSEALCKFGTASRALASSEMISRHSQIILSKQSLGRQLARKGRTTVSQSSDTLSRTVHFSNTYCDPDSYKGYVSEDRLFNRSLCGEEGAEDPERYDRDINFNKALLSPRTLEINLLDSTAQEEEEGILALARNLYAHKVFDMPDDRDLDQKTDNIEQEIETLSNRRRYLRLRSLIAGKNVAENSFNAIASRKAKGSGASTDYMVEILETLGFPKDKAEELIGDAPSYDAQMEILTKKIYQNPGFVTELIDKPANINRQQAALMSFELMQERDSYLSMRRQEIMMAVMLEQLLKKRFDQLRANFP